jgi:hypothetical protein
LHWWIKTSTIRQAIEGAALYEYCCPLLIFTFVYHILLFVWQCICVVAWKFWQVAYLSIITKQTSVSSHKSKSTVCLKSFHVMNDILSRHLLSGQIIRSKIWVTCKALTKLQSVFQYDKWVAYFFIEFVTCKCICKWTLVFVKLLDKWI